jgi:LysM repeat protein
MNFYAEFLAAIDVYENREQYFGTLVLDRPLLPSTANPVSVKASTRAPASSTPVKVARAKPASYTVRRGDTLAEIARQFRTSIANLMVKNRLAGQTIYAGQILLVR